MHGYKSLTIPWQVFVLMDKGAVHLLRHGHHAEK